MAEPTKKDLQDQVAELQAQLGAANARADELEAGGDDVARERFARLSAAADALRDENAALNAQIETLARQNEAAEGALAELEIGAEGGALLPVRLDHEFRHGHEMHPAGTVIGHVLDGMMFSPSTFGHLIFSGKASVVRPEPPAGPAEPADPLAALSDDEKLEAYERLRAELEGGDE
jgi:multidrug efflux pump subunit AcrA (membrane-fusion protein)